MKNITRIVAIALFCIAIAFNTPAIADTGSVNTSDSLQQAAQKVIEDDSAKEQFGQTDSGERLLDKAKAEGSKKLTKLAEEANSEADLPDSKKMFLKNLKPE